MAEAVDECSTMKFELAIDMLHSVGEAQLAVSGGSMLPSLWPRDILEIHRVAEEEVSKGDVVVFARQNRLIVHRVTQITRQGDRMTVITRGDRSAKADAPVPANELLGKVRSVRRGDRVITPRHTNWMQLASWTLRRSEILTRLLLHFALVRDNFLSPERAWTS